MDGVLIDSVGLNWQAYNEVLSSRYDVRVSENEIGNYVGRTLLTQVFLLNQHFHIQIDANAFTRDTDAIKDKLFKTIQPKPGVVTLLKSLEAAHIPRAVGTSMSLETTKARLTTAGIWQYFDTFVTEEDVKQHKPQPDVFLRVAEKLHTAPGHCVIFEDAPAGVEAAKSGGMKCIAVETPLVDRQNLSSADSIVTSLEAVDVPMLRKLLMNLTSI